MSRELKFASTNEALQHLANVTGKRVMVAVKNNETADEAFKRQIKNRNLHVDEEEKKEIINRTIKALTNKLRSHGYDIHVIGNSSFRAENKEIDMFAEIEVFVDNRYHIKSSDKHFPLAVHAYVHEVGMISDKSMSFGDVHWDFDMSSDDTNFDVVNRVGFYPNDLNVDEWYKAFEFEINSSKEQLKEDQIAS